MIVFYTLLAKYLNTDPEIYNYLINYQYDDFNKFKMYKFQSNHYYLISLLSDIVKYKDNLTGALQEKYACYQNTRNNSFMRENDKISFFQIFESCQKHYLSLSKFVNIVKFKKLKPANQYDMYLNNFNKDVCTIIQTNRKYLFTLFDLKEIINTNLSNLDYGFVDVTSIKNPYNNIPFSLSNLYNIYFYFKFHYYNLPNLFHLFFLSNFDLAYFERHYEYQIKKQNLQNKIKSLTPKNKREEIINMFKLYNKFHKKNKIEIPQDDFPDDSLCSIMNNYLKIYLSYKNSSTQNDKNMHKDELFHRLKQFQNFNPTFGRTYIYRRIKKRAIEYDDKHPRFNEYSRIGLHNAHIEKIQFPNYVSISANNDNNDTETEREDIFNIFRSVLINRDNNDRNSTALLTPSIIDLSLNNDSSPFFFRFDSSNNTIAPTEFVYRTPSPMYNEINDNSSNFLNTLSDDDSISSDDSDSIPPLINVQHVETDVQSDDETTVIYGSEDSNSVSTSQY